MEALGPAPPATPAEGHGTRRSSTRKLRQVAASGTVLSPEVGGVLAKPQAANRESIDAGWASLTVREQETLELVSAGASNKIIARSSASPRAREGAMKHVLQKLNLRNRFEAAV